MELSKLTTIELLHKCKELNITKCKSKSKSKLIELIQSKLSSNKQFIVEDKVLSDLENNDINIHLNVGNKQPNNFNL